ncbi:hypothetical protein [Mesorhizobium sp. M0768]|uniref:hypothetical protein n=1 Tax=Mesorhizobium sp. M0768 TaxID=2956996 RepID=UPI0033371DB2
MAPAQRCGPVRRGEMRAGLGFSTKTFTRLIKEGRGVADIAAIFGLMEQQVKRILALGDLSPKIREAYRREEIDTETVRHLTMASKAQQKDWLALYADPDQHAPRFSTAVSESPDRAQGLDGIVVGPDARAFRARREGFALSRGRDGGSRRCMPVDGHSVPVKKVERWAGVWIVSPSLLPIAPAGAHSRRHDGGAC